MTWIKIKAKIADFLFEKLILTQKETLRIKLGVPSDKYDTIKNINKKK